MCGFVGVLRLNADSPVEEVDIIRMRETMYHRGPDDAGVYMSPDGRIGMGHRRLTIVDLSSAGRQPMSNEDGTVWLAFNGEIYNHLELRKGLEARGHRYRSNTDTETVIHLYEELGADCVNQLQGMFSFAVWDSRRGEMFLARDRMGIKPLCYAWHGGYFMFASEIKALLAFPGFPRELDEISLCHYLTFLSTPAPSTLFKGIRKLPAGHRLFQKMDGETNTEEYWDAIVPSNSCPSYIKKEADYAEQISVLLSDSIKSRMMSDVPFGVLLSGGLDSSANVALMARHMERPVDTFTVGFKGHEVYNEFQYARRIARDFETNHHEVLLDEEDLLDFLPKLMHHQDEPIADPVCIPLYFVSKLARDNGVKVVQVGEGSDELFCGYQTYMNSLWFHEKVWPYLQALSLPLKKSLYLSARGLSKIFHRGFQLRDSFRKAIDSEEHFWGGAIGLTETDKAQILSRAFQNGNKKINSYEAIRPYIERIARKKPGSDFLERMIYLELKHRLPETLLMRVDKLTMATSVEARVPFLDHRLVEFAMTIPMAVKVKEEAKYILKKSVEGLIPDEIIYRKKQGFAAPVREWMLHRLGETMKTVFRESAMRQMEIFDYSQVDYMLAAHRKGHSNYSGLLWTLFNLHLWYDHWIVREETPFTKMVA